MDNNTPAETWIDKRFDIPPELLSKGVLLDNYIYTLLIPASCFAVGVANMARNVPFFHKPQFHVVAGAIGYLAGQIIKVNNEANIAIMHSSMMKYAKAHPELFPRENAKWGTQLHPWHPIR